MYLKEMLPIVLGLILLSSIFGMVYLFQIASQQDAVKLYQKTSLPAIWKKISEIDINFELSRAFEYTLYEIINQGGIMEPSAFVKKVYNIFSGHVKNYPHTYNYELSLEPEPKNFASGKRAEMEVTLKVTLKGSEVESVKIIERSVSSNIRAQYLYEKAYMFYRYALEGKPIHCFEWDGNKKIKVTVYSFGDTSKVQLHWNLTQASYKSGSGGVHEKFENELYEVFECTLSNGQSCSVELSLNNDKAIIYRAQLESGESCKDLSCKNFIPMLIEKNKPYSICIATRENVAEKIKEEVENNCRDGCLPRKAEGSTSCYDCPDRYPSDYWALGRVLGCMNGCDTTPQKVKNCLKENLRNFIQNIVDQIASRESDSEVEWNITVSIDSLSYSSTPGDDCPTGWTTTCGSWSCKGCYCPEPDESEEDGGESSSSGSSGGSSGGSSKFSPYTRIYTYTLFPLTKYSEKPLIWKFSYTTGAQASKVSVGACTEHSDSSCPPPPDCSCPPSCSGGGIASRCVEKKVYQYKYSYSYDYTYTLTITIKDKKRNIILAGE